MDTLAYLHLTATYDASDNSELETTLDYSLFFQALNWTKCSNAASISLILCVITFFTLSTASSSQALEKGNKSSEVTALQKQLQTAGYFNGPVTGYYGTLTQQAVKDFQKTKGLTVSGIADTATLTALNPETSKPTQPEVLPSQATTDSEVETNSTLAPQAATDSEVETNSIPALKKGITSSEVAALQKQLQAAGYFDGPVTGYYGTLTQNAVIAFQKARGINANGVADSNTLNALNIKEIPAPEPAKETLKPFLKATPKPAQETPTPTQETPQPVIVDKLKAVTKSTKALEKGRRGSEVTELQRKLQAAGYFDGPVTGYFGTLTQEAVIAFQKAHSIVPDGVADSSTLSALETPSVTSEPVQKSIPEQEITDNSQEKIKGKLPISPSTTPSVQKAPIVEDNQQEININNSSQGKIKGDFKISPVTTPSPKKNTQKVASDVESSPKEVDLYAEEPLEKASPLQTKMKLEKTISGKISPKSIVHSGNGLFFAQNMMYSHTITVYDRNHNLVKTIPDTVKLPDYGFSQFKGNYQGAPVEAAFSHNGEYAWVSNYQMYGNGFANPGSDDCSPAQRTDKSFLYRINTANLDIEKVIQVGSVPKYVAATPDNNLVLVSNWCSWDLSVINTDTNKEIKRIPLGRYPRGIVVDSASKNAYVAVMGSYDIAAVNLKNFSVGWLKNVGRSPRHLNIDPNDKYLYSTLNGEGNIAKIDLKTDKVVKKVSTGSEPRSMVISADGQLLYVVNYGSNTVSKVRTSDLKVMQTVNVNSSPIGITYDPVKREVWVACYSGSIMVFQD
jgi:YVTN family beta-propeller protein